MNNDNSEILSTLKNNLKQREGYKLLAKLFDENCVEELNQLCKFNNIDSGIACGFGKIAGNPSYAFVHSVDTNGAAMSSSQAIKLSKLYKLAAKSGYPIVGIFNSHGAALNEGNGLLEAYGDIIRECSKLEGIVPQIAVINGMCFGAMSLIAGCFDIVIMTKNSKMGIDIGGKYSDCDTALKEGNAHIIAEDEMQAIYYVQKMIKILPRNNLSVSQLPYFKDCSCRIDLNGDIREYIHQIADKDTFMEMQKEYGRHFIIGFICLKGHTVGIVASDSKSLDIADYDSCSKAARFVMFCDSYNIPLITIVDTSGFNSIKGATKLVSAYSNATVPKISLVIGKAYGSSYTVLCSKRIHDIVMCWTSAEISILNPDTAVELLWKDKLHSDGIDFKEHRKQVISQYINEEMSPIKACEDGVIDDVFVPNETRDRLSFALSMLSDKRQINLPKKHGNINI